MIKNTTGIHTAFKVLRRVWVFAGLTFLIWLAYSYQSRDFPASILESDNLVVVTQTNQYLGFIPTTNLQDIGVIFYPGGMVDPQAYAPLARQIAENGFAVYIVKLPLRSAPFPGQEAEVLAYTHQLMEDNPEIKQWVLGGHSRGAAIASRFAAAEPDLWAGLILIGTSHPKESEFNLAQTGLKVMKIYGTQDGLASPAEMQETSQFLPTNTSWVKIEGGNHAQFAYVGFLLGDNSAEISREEQQQLTLTAILNMLNELN